MSPVIMKSGARQATSYCYEWCICD